MDYRLRLFKIDEWMHQKGHSPALYCAFVDWWCFGAPFDPWGKRTRIGDLMGDWRSGQLFDWDHAMQRDPQSGVYSCLACGGPCKKYPADTH